MVKPSIKKLLIERGRELNREKIGELNLLQIRQSYLVRKVQSGMMQFLADLHFVQAEIVSWHKKECDKVKLQSRCEEINSAENVRIYHHELHKRHLKITSILKLETDDESFTGHDECSQYLEHLIGKLLLQPAVLDSQA